MLRRAGAVTGRTETTRAAVFAFPQTMALIKESELRERRHRRTMPQARKGNNMVKARVKSKRRERSGSDPEDTQGGLRSREGGGVERLRYELPTIGRERCICYPMPQTSL